MKSLLSLILSLILLITCASADSISLPEKMQMQIESGSGFKGQYSIEIEKNSSKHSTQGNIEYNSNGTNSTIRLTNNNDEYLILNNKNENSVCIGNTQYNLLNLNTYKNAVLVNLACNILNAPNTFNMIFSMLNYKHDYNMDTALLEKKYNDERNLILSEAFDRLMPEIDIWLEKYMVQDLKSIKKDKNSGISMEYIVPYENFKELLKTIVLELKQDSFLLDALKESMPYEYSQKFLSLDDMEYIDFVIDSIDIKEDILLGKTFSVDGQIQSSYINLPLYDKDIGAYNIKFTQNNLDKTNTQSIELITKDKNIELTYDKSNDIDSKQYKGTVKITCQSNKNENYHFNFNLEHYEKEYVDNDGKSNLDTEYSLDINNIDDTNSVKIDDYKISYARYLNSAVAKNASTKINETFSIENQSKKEKLSFDMKAKTTSPFEINTSNKDNIVIIDLNNDKDTKVLLEAIKKEVSKFCSDIDELNLYKILEEKVLNLNVYIPIN